MAEMVAEYNEASNFVWNDELRPIATPLGRHSPSTAMQLDRILNHESKKRKLSHEKIKHQSTGGCALLKNQGVSDIFLSADQHNEVRLEDVRGSSRTPANEIQSLRSRQGSTLCDKPQGVQSIATARHRDKQPLKHCSTSPFTTTELDGQEEDNGQDIVCYGAIKAIEKIQIDVEEQYQGTIHYNGDSLLALEGCSVQLSARSASILTTLSEVGAALEFSLLKCSDSSTYATAYRQKRRVESSQFALTVIIYGRRDDADDIGRWLGSMSLYLETPTHCDMNVPYVNPHKVSDDLAPVIMTHQLASLNAASDQPSMEEDWVPSNLFTSRSYPEAIQPVLLKSQLHPHQRQALTFMQNRERGWDVHNERCTDDLWRHRSDTFGRQKYVERFSGTSSFKAPPPFRGGLLADEMGLGKTCTMLAVIAADLETSRGSIISKQVGGASSMMSTLIIVPLPLLQVWEKQIKEHFKPGTISWTTYYGALVGADLSFSGYDIVLTTYGKVSQEWRSRKTNYTASRPVSDTHWRRIVLDEAHIIKNRHTDMTKAVTELHADRRWCMTGTPIQNRSSDLFSLLQFLKVHPYDNLKYFEQVFTQPWKNTETDALLKLQEMMSIIAIRRPRAMVALPAKEEIVISVLLDDQERFSYEQVRKGVVEVIDAAFNSDANFGGSYLNALQRINDLRFICNHGIPCDKKQRMSRASGGSSADSIARELGMLLGAEDAAFCTSCGQLLSRQIEHNYLAPPIQKDKASASISCTCMLSSSPSASSSSEQCTMPGSPASSVDISDPPSPSTTIQHISSKVRMLVDNIEKTPLGEKCAVFSFRITTLNLISHALTLKSISHISYDGTMSRSKRDGVLSSFSNSTNGIKVILVSISCGGQGLDLTAANHAFLVEPQWNPMLEEQALSRVYRLGQTKPVRLCRFVVKETWEERIVDLQRRKRRLAELIVDQKGLESSGARILLASLKDLV